MLVPGGLLGFWLQGLSREDVDIDRERRFCSVAISVLLGHVFEIAG